MATIHTSKPTTEEVDIEITVDYCFQRAAEAISYTADMRLGQGTSGYGQPIGFEYAREWRELGLAIHATTSVLQEGAWG